MAKAPKTVKPYDILKEKGISTTLDDMDREILDSGNWKMMCKGQNNLKSDPNAYGYSHSTFKRDPVTGKITNYETYEANPRNLSTGVEKVKRYDGTGENHFNKVTKEYVDTPHVHDKNVHGGVRPANPNEIRR